MQRTVDLRCDSEPRRLFAKLLHDPQSLPLKAPGNLIEFSCRDCRKRLLAEGHPIDRVLHRFDILGELIESEVIPGSAVEHADSTEVAG